MRKINYQILSLLFITLSFSLVSCRQETGKKIVSDVLVETFDNELGQKIANVSFLLDLDNAQLPALYYDLPNNLGEVELQYADEGNYVNLQVNLSEAFKLPAGQAQLPNGQSLPIYNANGVVTINIPQIKGSVYLATNGESTVIGFAIAISALDGIGNKLGRVGLFPTWMVNNVKVVAGLFADTVADNTGIAAFVNINRVVVRELETTTPTQAFFYIYKYNNNFLKYAERVYEDFKNDTKNERMILYPALR
jgi:hypothetical protein